LVLFAVKAAQRADLIALEPTDAGTWRVADVPKIAPSNAVTVLHYAAVGLFAEVPRLDERWPDLTHVDNAVIILSLRTLPDVPSSGVIKAIERRVRTLRSRRSELLVVGIDPELKRIFDRSGLSAIIGEDNIRLASPELFAELSRAVADGRAWIAGNSQT
jgi:SulP family sulfate permease